MKTVALGIVLLVLAGSQADDGAAAKRDMEAMQGEWTMASGAADGYPIPDTMLRDFRRVCKGDEVVTTMGGRVYMKATVKLDPSKSPKAIDYAVTDGPTKGKTQLGIYQLDGDTFKSCFAAPGAERPADFASKPGDQRTSTVWKRAAKAAEPAPK